MRDWDGVALLENAATCEYRNGLFHITSTVGTRTARSCMQPHTFIKCLEGAKRAAAAFYADTDGNVVELRAAEH